MQPALLVGHDLGTSSDKAVLTDAAGRILASASAAYPLSHPRPNWAEQDAEDWWRAVCHATRAVLDAASVAPAEIAGVCLAGQMLGLVPVDLRGRAVRPAISWLDSRGDAEARRICRRLGGTRMVRAIAGAAPTGKDIVAKVAWLRRHEPETFTRTAAFLDATGYLVARATGHQLADQTAAGGTGITSRHSRDWSPLLARLTRFPLHKLPRIVHSTDVAGTLSAEAAGELGLHAGTPVVMGLADVPAAAVGSGAVREGDAHLYLGTSSWLGVTLERPHDIGRHGMVSVASGDPDRWLLIAESETAGACVDWLAALVVGNAETGTFDYASFDALAAAAPAGAGGLLFLPWMFGERSPVPDPHVRAAFVNLSLEHDRRHLARAVYEGIAHNLRWSLDVVARDGLSPQSVRVIGGGARSDLWCQTLADVTGRDIERVADPQLAGARGAALIGAVGLGLLADVGAARDLVPVDRSFDPEPGLAATFDAAHTVFRGLYRPLAAAGRKRALGVSA